MEANFICYQSNKYTCGGKIILPSNVLGELLERDISHPYTFRITYKTKKIFVGVIEFTANEGEAQVPEWIMKQLGIVEGDVVSIGRRPVPKGEYMKIQPLKTKFIETDYKHALENALKNFTCVSVGDVIPIYDDEIIIKEVKPDLTGSIMIVDRDIKIDFDAPVDYVEPVKITKIIVKPKTFDGSNAKPVTVAPGKIIIGKINPYSRPTDKFPGKGNKLTD